MGIWIEKYKCPKRDGSFWDIPKRFVFWFYICLLLKSINKSILSSFAALFLLIAPHFLHLKTITYPFFPSISILTGSKSPWHSSALSPGFLSTCFECKQYGQWFLQEYPSYGTFLPQFSHINSSSISVNLLSFNI